MNPPRGRTAPHGGLARVPTQRPTSVRGKHRELGGSFCEALTTPAPRGVSARVSDGVFHATQEKNATRF